MPYERVDKQKAKEIFFKLLDKVNKGFGPIEIFDRKQNKIIAYLISPEDYKKRLI